MTVSCGFGGISGGFSCTREMKAEDNIAPIWAHLLFWVFFPPSLLLLFFKSYRNYLRESWLYGSEDKKPDWEFMVKADQLKLVKKRPRRNTSKLAEEVCFDIHGRDLIGICYTAGLGYDNDATYHGKTVKIYTNQGVISLPQILDVNLEHVCNWLVGVTLRLRSERPELGLGLETNKRKTFKTSTTLLKVAECLPLDSCSSLLNEKMGGDLEKIRIVGQYFVEVWKAAGMKMDNVKFLWASEEINSKPEEYWIDW